MININVTTKARGTSDCPRSFHGAQVVGSMRRPHDKGERAVGFMVMVSTTTATGGGKGAEAQTFPGFTGLGRGERTS
jgi:hypothetical protein